MSTRRAHSKEWVLPARETRTFPSCGAVRAGRMMVASQAEGGDMRTSSVSPAGHGRRLIVAATAALLTLAPGVGASAAEAGSTAPERAQRQFVVMTQNLYLGANLQPLFGKSGLDLIRTAAATYAHVVQTDFPDRAQAIAKEIAAKRPEVVGLQEVYLFKRGPDPAHLETTYDFLTILLGALSDHGASYRAVAVGTHFSGALPIGVTADGTLTPWASLTDRDAIIVRTDLPEKGVQLVQPGGPELPAHVRRAARGVHDPHPSGLDERGRQVPGEVLPGRGDAPGGLQCTRAR